VVFLISLDNILWSYWNKWDRIFCPNISWHLASLKLLYCHLLELVVHPLISVLFKSNLGILLSSAIPGPHQTKMLFNEVSVIPVLLIPVVIVCLSSSYLLYIMLIYNTKLFSVEYNNHYSKVIFRYDTVSIISLSDRLLWLRQSYI